MNYRDFEDFIENRMRMSHVYQPVMLMTLLQRGGKASITQIAKAILDHDESQIEYYEKIVANMVGRVLRSHGLVKKDGSDYFLCSDEKLTKKETSGLVELCREKLTEYEAKRGEQIWQHRKLSSGYISGTLKFQVLKEAQFHCELCGVSADVRALEVDHIVPRTLGGTDDPSNLQALCYSCNSMKRDRDETDFRKVREPLAHQLFALARRRFPVGIRQTSAGGPGHAVPGFASLRVRCRLDLGPLALPLRSSCI